MILIFLQKTHFYAKGCLAWESSWMAEVCPAVRPASPGTALGCSGLGFICLSQSSGALPVLSGTERSPFSFR